MGLKELGSLVDLTALIKNHELFGVVKSGDWGHFGLERCAKVGLRYLFIPYGNIVI